MKVKDLKEPYYSMAMANLYKGKTEETHLHKAFIWWDTKQGFDFWDDVDEGLDPLGEETKYLVLEWAKDKNLLREECVPQQTIKLMEEVGELARAILKGNKKEQEDAIGDIRVVLDILANQLGFDSDECYKVAYNVIKDRKGKTVNGTFIKEQ